MNNSASTIIVISMTVALAYGMIWVPRENGLFRSVLKTLPVLLLAVAAFVSQAPLLLIAALILCAAGDAFLSRGGEGMFLAGLGSFLMAHLVFAVLFLYSQSVPLAQEWAMIVVIVISLLLIALVLANLWKHLGSMKMPVAIYTLIIGTMNICAWGTGQPVLLLAGVTLFVFSDMVLAHELFYWQKSALKRAAAYTVWFSYFAAQTMITISLV